MRTLWQDLRYSMRMLAKRPGFTTVAVLTLALGIGANTVIFSVVNRVLLDPFPYRDHARLVLVQQSLPKIGVREQLRASGPEFVDFKNQSQVFEQTAAWEPVSRNLITGQEPERVAAAKVSADLFAMLGVEPGFGRTISAEDEGPKGERVLVISHGLWQRRFGGEPNVLGQKVTLDDEPFTIIGVMPPRFRFDGGDAWFPFPMDLSQSPRNARAFLVLGRLRPGINAQQAQAELEVTARRQEQEFAGSVPEYAGRGVTLVPLINFVLGIVRPTLLVLLSAVGLVLLIACANITNLLLARAAVREKEIAIRIAMGASRLRVVRQMLTESMLLAMLGAVAGLLLALWGIDALVAIVPSGSIPAGTEINLDARVFAFTLMLSLLTAILVGLWPAFQTSNAELNESLKEGGRKSTLHTRARRSQSVLIVSEVALSLLLLIMAGLMIQSFARLARVNPGFATDDVLTMRINLPPARYTEGGQKATFFGRLIERVERLPGVESAGTASHLPLVYTEDLTITVEGREFQNSPQTQNLDTRTVSPSYFRTMDIPLVKGELFTAQNTADMPGVVCINETMARRYWPSGDPLGKRIKLGSADSKNEWLTVQGVVADSAQGPLDAAMKPEVYFPLAQLAGRYRRMNLAVRARSGVSPMSLVDSVQREVRVLDKDQPIYQIQTMKDLVNEAIGPRRFAMLLLGLFAGVALVLASVGIYGVMAYVVSQRTHEIGIRMALGAQPGDVFKLVVKQGMMLALIGIAIGLVASLALTRLMKSLLYGVSATDPVTFIGVALLLTVVALLACYIPARRATKVDPMVALRYE